MDGVPASRAAELAKPDVNPILAMISSVWDRVEYFFDSLGLMSGFFSPFARGIFIFGLVSLPIWAVRPSAMFTKDGSTRPWLWLDPEPANKPTTIAWYVPGALLAIWVSLFV
jgi:hypothetical protein